MPNVGRPSGGCKPCRDRKVKCDQERPSCTQCIRTRRQCHGYRDPISMMFRNENDVVVRKAEMKYKELAKAKTPKALFSQDSSSSSSSSSEETPSPESSMWTLVPPLEDQAIGFFFANYVMTPKLVPRGELDFLHELLGKPWTEKILQTSVAAAGLAGLANSTQSPRIMKKAQEMYVSALSMTNKAIRSPELAKKDSTLISVIMLGMYENSMFKDKDSIDFWVKHIEGACALISMRGEQLLHHSVGLRLFQQFYNNIVLAAFTKRSRIPQGMSELWEAGSRIYSYNVHGRQWTTGLVIFAQMAAELSSDHSDDPVGKVRSAIAIDKEFNSLMPPDVWKFDTVRLKKPSAHVFQNLYHIYTDPWITFMLNNLRGSQYYLHHVVCEELEKGSQASPPLFSEKEIRLQMARSTQAMEQIAKDMCASIPQITGQVPFPENISAGVVKFPVNFSKSNPQPPGTFLKAFRPTGLHHAIWPLYTASRFDRSSYDMREWAIGRLYWLGIRLGHRQAIVLADDLKEIQLRKRETKTRLVEIPLHLGLNVAPQSN
ncbi:hypothetical protein EJ04DRAFT_455658 [Polyplosphaeria fusca]|uniref:Zn(2)-C6 fungal-type domain-containing protein n=1 Tax=Polyplosphaeria fusca TaxID=682080 RepID=A0A9P4RC02_9PLEO|nr:hypothetical protein EJ04DRAFT_455658 [Polyplosphaeria fusca]